MDPKLAETIARINAEHPTNVVDAANDPSPSQDASTTPKRDLFAEMYPILTKKLLRGKDGGIGQH